MLKKKERLDRKAFSRFFMTGKRFHSASLQLVYHPYDSFHASVVVPKKVVRSAVARNKLRRRVYDILRRSARKNGIYIVLVKQGAAGLSYRELSTELSAIIGRTKNTG